MSNTATPTPLDDGGPAFPATVQDDQNCYPRYAGGYGGMSLRDWFAGQALAALPHIGCGADLRNEELAEASYQISDAMIAARKGAARE